MKINFIILLLFLSLISLITSDESTTSEPKIELDKKCKFDVDEGNGTDISLRYYFDIEDNDCKTFNYTGEGGNDNNFENELDCLNDCFTGIKSDKPESPKEEDIVFIQHEREHDEPISMEIDCTASKDSGNGKESFQRFYYNDKWHACFAFIYNGEGGNTNNFETIDDCESTCRHADGTVCTGPIGPLEFITPGPNCDTAKCPKGSSCHQGMIPQCCNDDEMKEIEIAHSDTCPDSTMAYGNVKEYFQSIFGSTCDDLICPEDQKCIQVSKNFAKCCGGQKRLADDIPVSAGALHVRIDGEDKLDDDLKILNIQNSRLLFKVI